MLSNSDGLVVPVHDMFPTIKLGHRLQILKAFM